MGGSSSGGGARTPYEAPNTASHAQALRVVHAICEGPIGGFPDNNVPLKHVYFDNTPVQNQDSTYNFKGVKALFFRGTGDQTYLPGFDVTERVASVGAEVKKNTPIIRTITDKDVDTLKVTVGVQSNRHLQENGDSVPSTTTLLVELVKGVSMSTHTVTFTEKSSSMFYTDVVFDNLPDVPFNLRVTRVTPDSSTDRLTNMTTFASYVECKTAKLSYPCTAIAAFEIDSDQFGGKIPTITYDVHGILMQIPSNYDPVTRKYEGVWDGSFKEAWTNNPAWVLYHLCTSPRYSSIARQLNSVDIDKSTLYAVGRYCDELVDDGFGGKEPRCVCNAYVTEERQAYDVISDLCSVFQGYVLWNGQQMTVTVDKNDTAVALYTNNNVVGGIFTYAGASRKKITTAVQVSYANKHDSYEGTADYVQDDDAVAKYGLNVKSVTAFGCDSRGQAMRLAAWILQTELRQQETITFTLGREGIRHMPNDVIQIADNQYAGIPLGGRLIKRAGVQVTLDRDVENAVGGTLYTVTKAGVQSVQVTGQNGRVLTLASAIPAKANDNWILHKNVASKLYRAIGITEDTDEGTYTVTALRHDPSKYGVVDAWANFPTTVNIADSVVIDNIDVRHDGDKVVVGWDGTVSGAFVSYQVEVYRNGQLYRRVPDTDTTQVELFNLPDGSYRIDIRGRTAKGHLSEVHTATFVINYTITGLRATPKLWAIQLDWTLPQSVVMAQATEVWYAKADDIEKAQLLANVPYPQSTYTLQGVQLTDAFYFWVRLVDASKRTGKFTSSVRGICDTDPSPIIEQIAGAITESELSKELLAQLDGTKVTADLQKEVADRIADVNAARVKAAADLTAKAKEIGTQITAVENVNAQQAQQINTVTAAQGVTVAGLETEKKARADGDAAEAAARTMLAGKADKAAADIVRNDSLRVSGDKANADAVTALGTRVGGAESSISGLQNTAAQQGKALAEATQNLNAKIEAVQADLTEQVTTRVNLRDAKYDVNTYYPVVFALSTYGKRYAFRVFNTLGNQGEVPWSTHRTKTFSVNLSWQANAYGWGTQDVNRVIDQFSFNYTAQSPVLGPEQLTNNSHEYIWLRGGAGYDVVHHKSVPPTVVETSHTTGGQTVATVPYNADLLPKTDQVRTDAAIAAVSADLTTHKSAQASIDAAQTTEINTAKSRLGAAESSVTALQKTVADSQQALSLQQETVEAMLKSGGENLIENGDFENDRNGWRDWGPATRVVNTLANNRKWLRLTSPDPTSFKGIAQAITAFAPNADYTLSFDAYSEAPGREAKVLIHQRGDGNNEPQMGKAIPLSAAPQRHSYTFRTVNSSTKSDLYLMIGGAGGAPMDWHITDIQLERGTVATPFKSSARSLVANITETKTAVTALNGKVQSLYTLKVEAVGARRAVAGLALGADGATGDSQFLVTADKFALVRPGSTEIKAPFVVSTVNGVTKLALSGDLYADGTILGKHIAANQTISAPNINGGSLNIGGGRFTVNGAGQVNISAQAGNVGLKVTNERIEVYDDNGELRVRLGKLT